MSARKRREGESFKVYRYNLIAEQEALSIFLRGKLFSSSEGGYTYRKEKDDK